MGFTSRLRRSVLILTAIIVVMLGYLIVTAYNQRGETLGPVAIAPTPAPTTEACVPPPGHAPVRLRLGTVMAIEESEIILRTESLPGETTDMLQVELTLDTPVIEIRVPSYLSAARRQVLENGGQAIERVPVPQSSLYAGQEVVVVSRTDTYCQTTLRPDRLEYEVIIDTSNEP